MTPSDAWLSSIAEQLDQAALVVGPGREILYVTAAAERLLQLSAQRLLGSTIDDLLPQERLGELRNFDDVLLGGAGRRLRSALRLADGRRLEVSVTLEPCLDDTGQVVAVSARYASARTSAQWLRSSIPPRALRAEAGHAASGSSSKSGVFARLEQLEARLHWLEERLSQPSTLAPMDDPAERARALMVVAEARGLSAQFRSALASDEDAPAEAIPAAPKLPRF
jgi:PAS domain S-box-containing protein